MGAKGRGRVIVFCGERDQPRKYSADDCEQKTVSELFTFFGVPSGHVMLLVTPLSMETLQLNCKPASMCKELVLQEWTKFWERPAYYLTSKPAESGYFFLQVSFRSDIAQPYPVLCKFDLTALQHCIAADLIGVICRQLGERITNTVSLWTRREPIRLSRPAREVLESARADGLLMVCSVGQDFAAVLAHRRYVLEEVAMTEKTYVQGLKQLTKVYHERLKPAVGDKGHGLLKSIFDDFPGMVAAHRPFQKSLDKSLGSDSMCVGPAFLELSMVFKVAKPFVVCTADRAAAVAELAAMPKANAILMSISPDGVSDLKSLLISPIQRLPRYALFLGNLLKHTPRDHPDFALLEVARDVVNENTASFNAECRRVNAAGRWS